MKHKEEQQIMKQESKSDLILDEMNMPLVHALQKYCNAGPARFHIPGHAGEAVDPIASLLKDPFAFDLTEVNGLDDLHQPEGCIAQAQALAATWYGAQHTFFLVQGSTVGNQAMMLSLCAPGDLVLMQRNMHQSLLHAAVLAQVKVVWLAPEIDPDSGMAGGVAATTVQQAFDRYPNAVALIMQHPNYYGHVREDLSESIACAHHYGAAVLIDEAHGAHFGLHPQLPKSALAHGADAVVQSIHKMAGSLTMGAMLHLRGDRIDPVCIRRVLRILQTSSPSYLIMASIDAVRGILQAQGPVAFERTLHAIASIRRMFEANQAGQSALKIVPVQDPYKLVLYDATASRGGFELQAWFEQQGIYAEMADPRHLVFVITWQTSDESLSRLTEVIQSYVPKRENEIKFGRDQNSKYLPGHNLSYVSTKVSETPSQLPSLADWIGVGDEQKTSIPLDAAAGYRSADAITPYPPGIPYIMPGEIMTTEQIAQLRSWLQAGATIKGLVWLNEERTHDGEDVQRQLIRSNVRIRVQSHVGLRS
jgi:arginine decarboxylase